MQDTTYAAIAGNIPNAVAATVTAHAHQLFAGEFDPNEIESKIVAFADNLTRTMALALMHPGRPAPTKW